MMRVVITAGGYYYYAVWLGPAGGTQLDSGVSTGFWLYRVCMYVYENCMWSRRQQQCH
jgi:hypothetical protein